MSALLALLGRRGREADLVADAVVMLTRAAFDRENPRELEEVTLRAADGTGVTVRRFPSAWARRLVRAQAAGAFEKRGVEKIVETILTTEEPV